jgi:hypothetical protein
MNHDSRIQEMRERLEKELAKAREGVTALFQCEPRASDSRGRIRVRARFFFAPNVHVNLRPVIKCLQSASFGQKRLSKKRGSEIDGAAGEYEAAFVASLIGIGKFSLMLHPTPDSDPIAACTVWILQKSRIAALRREISKLARPA